MWEKTRNHAVFRTACTNENGHIFTIGHVKNARFSPKNTAAAFLEKQSERQKKINKKTPFLSKRRFYI